jgi:hypothetical protein
MGNTKKCPACAEENQEAALKCLAHDHVRTRLEGETWSVGFGIGSNTLLYAEVLELAGAFVRSQPIERPV